MTQPTDGRGKEIICFESHPVDRENLKKVQEHLNLVYENEGLARTATRSDAIRFALRQAGTVLITERSQPECQ